MQVITITTTGLQSTGKTILKGLILVGGSANSAITLNDSLDGLGTDKIGAKALANTSAPNAIPIETVFATGVYATITGTSAVAYAFVE